MKIVFFDFYRTLSNSRYFEIIQSELSIKLDIIFRESDNDLCNRWWNGKVHTGEFVEELAILLNCRSSILLDSLKNSLKLISFNEKVFNSVEKIRQGGIKTGIATINSDYFTNVIVPYFNLESKFDFILNSSDYKTLNKPEMIKRTLDNLNLSTSDVLLIDDNERILEDFKKIGGNVFFYHNDDDYDIWFKSELLKW
ncbi:MAG: HAD hydrolase-like protein [Candidatus Delongbacteria bacterium]|nr:HAD hydrolase-like protein [Candidatus Delongbacteria bacterium]MBN2835087.1 HAD hydrolase-like protein [Candidatus Delongbacteria bacterium]